MTGIIDVHHPKQDETVKKSDFAAYGKADVDVKNIKGVLKKSGMVIKTGTTSRGAPHWVIVFQGVANGDYTLEVSGDSADTVSYSFKVGSLVSTAARIGYPPSGLITLLKT